MPYMEKRTMICGLGVYHERDECGGGAGELSSLGFVASYNKTCTKYWPATNLMPKPGDELATNLDQHMLNALNHFKEVNGSFPERVILYRDALANSKQPDVLKETEVAQMAQACASLNVKCLYCLVSRN